MFFDRTLDNPRNVYGIDIHEGKIRWQIEESEKIKGSFDSFCFDNQGRCVLTGCPNIEFDPSTGEIVEFLKWYK